MDGVLLTPLTRISTAGGDVRHAMKKCDAGYTGFGEAYFSCVHSGAYKGWKRHRIMTLNLVVAVGAVRFIVYDDRPSSKFGSNFFDITLSPEDRYERLTIAPMLWVAFCGVSNAQSLILNLADYTHDSEEIDSLSLDEIKFHW